MARNIVEEVRELSRSREELLCACTSIKNEILYLVEDGTLTLKDVELNVGWMQLNLAIENAWKENERYAAKDDESTSVLLRATCREYRREVYIIQGIKNLYLVVSKHGGVNESVIPYSKKDEAIDCYEEIIYNLHVDEGCLFNSFDGIWFNSCKPRLI